VQVPERVRGVTLTDAALVRAAHRADLQVHVWTVDDSAAMRRLLDLGVDGIMTDRPQVLKDVLVERAQWVRGAHRGS
jgi:glycerophosphoryl diester phosphodiesterase